MAIMLAGENRLVKDSLAEVIEAAFGVSVVRLDDHAGFANLFPTPAGEALLLMEYDLARALRVEDWEFWRRRPSATQRVALFSAPGSGEEALRWLQLGCDGYLPRSMSASAIVCAIRLMLRGERFVPSVLVDDMPRLGEPTTGGGLSPRQRQILALVATGASNKHIARALSIEEVTVKSHVKEIFRKLKVGSRTEAARYAPAIGAPLF